LGNRRFRMIATNPEAHAQTAGDPDVPEMQKLFDADTKIAGTLRDPVWTSRFRINSRMIDNFRARRIFLGGDSAHIHSPAGGQGMNTGIQDMVNLSWKLALVYQERANPSLLDTYTEERVPIIKSLLSTTEGATDLANLASPIVHQLVTHIAPFLLDFAQVRAQGARTLSQVGLNYRSSRLSKTESAPGQLRAGDRVPDIMVVASGKSSKAVPLYSVLDPSYLTLLWTGASAEPSSGAWPSLVRAVNVSSADDVESKQAFAESFGSQAGLFVVRPDAYLGFVGDANDLSKLRSWLEDSFLTACESGASVPAA
jgi:hypothetical protein